MDVAHNAFFYSNIAVLKLESEQNIIIQRIK